MTIESVTEFVRSLHAALPRKRWCVLGKGPSSDYYSGFDWDDFFVISLNHAAGLFPHIKLAHFADMEAFWDCTPILPPGQRVVMPWHPHLGMRPSDKTLADYSKSFEDVRLLSYNATSHGKLKRNPVLPDVRLKYFSAVAAFSILVKSGLKEVCSLGVDGGTGYGQAFDQKDRLRNGRTSFDVQTQELARLCRDAKVTHTPLWTGAPAS